MTKNCGNCKHHRGYMVEQEKVWYCENEESVNEGCVTEYSDTCEDWEEEE